MRLLLDWRRSAPRFSGLFINYFNPSFITTASSAAAVHIALPRGSLSRLRSAAFGRLRLLGARREDDLWAESTRVKLANMATLEHDCKVIAGEPRRGAQRSKKFAFEIFALGLVGGGFFGSTGDGGVCCSCVQILECVNLGNLKKCRICSRCNSSSDRSSNERPEIPIREKFKPPFSSLSWKTCLAKIVQLFGTGAERGGKGGRLKAQRFE